MKCRRRRKEIGSGSEGVSSREGERDTKGFLYSEIQGSEISWRHRTKQGDKKTRRQDKRQQVFGLSVQSSNARTLSQHHKLNKYQALSIKH